MTNSRFRNPRIAICSADQTVNNSTTLVPSTYLAIFNIPPGTYSFYLMYQHSSSAVADIKTDFSTSDGAGVKSNGSFHSVSPSSTANITFDRVGESDGTVQTIHMSGTFITSEQTDLILNFAQNTAEVSNTILKAGSTLILYQDNQN